MPTGDRLPRSPQARGGRAAVLGALGLSLGLHGAAFGAFAWFWDATPAQPITVFAVEMVPGDEIGPQPGSQQAEVIETLSSETPSATTQTTEAAATDMPSPSDPLPANSGPPAQTHTAAPADPPAEVPQPLEQQASKSAAAEAITRRAPEPKQKPALETAPPTPKATLLAPPPRPLAKPVALRPEPQPVPATADTAVPDALLAESNESPATSSPPSAPSSQSGTGDPLLESSQVSAAAPPRYSGAGLANPAPRYPFLARRRGQEGRVVLRVRVNPNGQAEAVSIQESSGYHLLDEAALETVRQWRFVPAHKANLTVAGLVDVPVSFRLTD